MRFDAELVAQKVNISLSFPARSGADGQLLPLGPLVLHCVSDTNSIIFYTKDANKENKIVYKEIVVTDSEQGSKFEIQKICDDLLVVNFFHSFQVWQIPRVIESRIGESSIVFQSPPTFPTSLLADSRFAILNAENDDRRFLIIADGLHGKLCLWDMWKVEQVYSVDLAIQEIDFFDLQTNQEDNYRFTIATGSYTTQVLHIYEFLLIHHIQDESGGRLTVCKTEHLIYTDIKNGKCDEGDRTNLNSSNERLFTNIMIGKNCDVILAVEDKENELNISVAFLKQECTRISENTLSDLATLYFYKFAFISVFETVSDCVPIIDLSCRSQGNGMKQLYYNNSSHAVKNLPKRSNKYNFDLFNEEKSDFLFTTGSSTVIEDANDPKLRTNDKFLKCLSLSDSSQPFFTNYLANNIGSLTPILIGNDCDFLDQTLPRSIESLKKTAWKIEREIEPSLENKFNDLFAGLKDLRIDSLNQICKESEKLNKAVALLKIDAQKNKTESTNIHPNIAESSISESSSGTLDRSVGEEQETFTFLKRFSIEELNSEILKLRSIVNGSSFENLEEIKSNLVCKLRDMMLPIEDKKYAYSDQEKENVLKNNEEQTSKCSKRACDELRIRALQEIMYNRLDNSQEQEQLLSDLMQRMYVYEPPSFLDDPESEDRDEVKKEAIKRYLEDQKDFLLKKEAAINQLRVTVATQKQIIDNIVEKFNSNVHELSRQRFEFISALSSEKLRKLLLREALLCQGIEHSRTESINERHRNIEQSLIQKIRENENNLEKLRKDKIELSVKALAAVKQEIVRIDRDILDYCQKQLVIENFQDDERFGSGEEIDIGRLKRIHCFFSKDLENFISQRYNAQIWNHEELAAFEKSYFTKIDHIDQFNEIDINCNQWKKLYGLAVDKFKFEVKRNAITSTIALLDAEIANGEKLLRNFSQQTKLATAVFDQNPTEISQKINQERFLRLFKSSTVEFDYYTRPPPLDTLPGSERSYFIDSEHKQICLVHRHDVEQHNLKIRNALELQFEAIGRESEAAGSSAATNSTLETYEMQLQRARDQMRRIKNFKITKDIQKLLSNSEQSPGRIMKIKLKTEEGDGKDDLTNLKSIENSIEFFKY
ncbi:MAG: hypothetical protein MHMPM18_001459, partial [Marteilia pararefringens]